MTTNDCIFCKIIQGEIPSTKIYEDETVTAFHDINPAAPTHILIIPQKHIPSVNALEPEDEKTVGHLFTVGRKLAEEAGISESGYRLLINTGPDSRQVVYHLHLHLLGGRKLSHIG
jgi:histidine triad (HIT) family protein